MTPRTQAAVIAALEKKHEDALRTIYKYCGAHNPTASLTAQNEARNALRDIIELLRAEGDGWRIEEAEVPDFALIPYRYAPGDYECKCMNCDMIFTGAKDSWRCRRCAVSSFKHRLGPDIILVRVPPSPATDEKKEGEG